MTDRPIIFSAPMVRALLAGHKTQTRRVLSGKTGILAARSVLQRGAHWMGIEYDRAWPLILPYAIGDRLWVREAHAILPRTAYRCSVGTGTIDQREHPSDGYSAAVFREGFDRSGAPRWRPSIHMPRWASRLTLIVTDVRVQRLNELTDADAIAEGLEWVAPTWGVSGVADSWNGDPRESYRGLLDHINGPGAWAANPWVVALTFRVIHANIDSPEAAQC